MSQEKTVEELTIEFTNRMPMFAFGDVEFGTEMEASSISSYLSTALDMFNTFLADYVTLPEKKVVMDAFSSFLDATLPNLPLSVFAKIVIRKVAMSAVETAYDMAVKYRDSLK